MELECHFIWNSRECLCYVKSVPVPNPVICLEFPVLVFASTCCILLSQCKEMKTRWIAPWLSENKARSVCAVLLLLTSHRPLRKLLLHHLLVNSLCKISHKFIVPELITPDQLVESPKSEEGLVWKRKEGGLPIFFIRFRSLSCMIFKFSPLGNRKNLLGQ